MTLVTTSDRSPTIPLDHDQSSYDAFSRVLLHLLDAVEANWQGTIEGTDPESLHDLRVAVRRTRSVLTEGKRVLPSDVRSHYGKKFAWVGDVTSPVRDLDVQIAEWDFYTAPLGDDAGAALAGVLDHLADRRRTAREDLARTLRSDRYRRLIDGWRAFLAAPAPEGGSEAREPIGRLAVGRIEAAQRKVLKRGRGIRAASPAEDLHELRKDAKKLRYLLECFGGLFATRRRQAFVKRLKALQDNLGEHQDAAVQVARLRELSQELHGSSAVASDTLLAVDKLIEHLDRRRIDVRAGFAARFAAYDTKQTARTLRELLASEP